MIQKIIEEASKTQREWVLEQIRKDNEDSRKY